MSLYGHKHRAILLLKIDNLDKTINIFNNLDTHMSLVEGAELVDIGCKQIRPVPKIRSEYKNSVEFNHQFLIFKS